MDAANAGRRQRHATRKCSGNRSSEDQQPLLLSGATPDAAVLASTAVATPLSTAFRGETVRTVDAGRAVRALAVAGRRVVGCVVAAGPEVGETVFAIASIDVMILAGLCGRAR